MNLNETNQRLVELALSVKTLASNLETMHEDLRRSMCDQRALHQRDFESLNHDIDRLTRTILDSQAEIRRLSEDIKSRVSISQMPMRITPISGVPILNIDSTVSPLPTPPAVTFKESGDINFTLTPRMWRIIKWVVGGILTASSGAGLWELLKRVF